MEENVGLIWCVVKRFAGRGTEAEDLFQIGSIGLLKAIDKFDLSYDVKFSTYAVPMITGEIKRFLRDDGMIKVSRSLKELSYKAYLKQEELQEKNGRDPTIEELAEALSVSTEDLTMAMERAEILNLCRNRFIKRRTGDPADGQAAWGKAGGRADFGSSSAERPAQYAWIQGAEDHLSAVFCKSYAEPDRKSARYFPSAGVENGKADPEKNAGKRIMPVSFSDTNGKYRKRKLRYSRMEEGKKKIRICLITMVLAAVVIGIFYYYYHEGDAVSGSEGTLIRRPEVASYVV